MELHRFLEGEDLKAVLPNEHRCCLSRSDHVDNVHLHSRKKKKLWLPEKLLQTEMECLALNPAGGVNPVLNIQK